MKRTLELAGLVLCGPLAAAILFIGCSAAKDTKQQGEAPGTVYETAQQIKAMPPCKAVVVQRAPCSVYLKTVDGKGFYLGSPGSKADVGGFLGVLKEGQRYDFPDAFLKYQSDPQEFH